MASRHYKKRSTVWLVVSLGLIGLAFWLSSLSRANASPKYQADIVDLDYVLTIDNPSSGQATVTMTVSNISADIFEVTETTWVGPIIDVLSLSARDADGNPLVVEHFPDSGRTGHFGDRADVWRVHCSGLLQIIIEYTIHPALRDIPWTSYPAYITPDWAGLWGETVFLIPYDNPCANTGSISVSFSLPTGWTAYTPWTCEGNSYNPVLPDGPPIDYLTRSSFALGQFDVYTRTVDTTEVVVVIYPGWPADVKDDTAQRSLDIFASLSSLFGSSGGPSEGGDRFLIIHNSPAPDGNDVILGEWANSWGGSYTFTHGYWDGGFVHQLSHRWLWWVWGFQGVSCPWFGNTLLFEMKTLAKLRINPSQLYGGTTWEDRLRGTYEHYREHYAGTGNDRALEPCNWEDYWLSSEKPFMVHFLLAKEIFLRTDGVHNYDDLWQVLLQK